MPIPLRSWTERKTDATTVAGSGNTDLLTWDVRGLERIYVQIHVATQNLDAFIISARPHAHASSTFDTLYSSSADFTTLTGILVGTSGDLTGITAGSKGWFMMGVSGIREIKLQASAAADSASVTIYAGGS